MSDTPPPRVVAPGKRISIALAVVVHLVLAIFLIYGIHWQTKVKDVVEVELVRPTPSPAPAPAARQEPTPKPEPRPEPKPVLKPEPKPLPPVKPDIAIKDKDKPKPKEEAKPKPEPPKFDPFQQQMAEEEKRLATHKQIADDERRLKQLQEAQAASQAAGARSKALASYTDRIRAKIRGNIVLPPELKGNPSAVFEVVQLPTGRGHFDQAGQGQWPRRLRCRRRTGHTQIESAAQARRTGAVRAQPASDLLSPGRRQMRLSYNPSMKFRPFFPGRGPHGGPLGAAMPNCPSRSPAPAPTASRWRLPISAANASSPRR